MTEQTATPTSELTDTQKREAAHLAFKHVYENMINFLNTMNLNPQLKAFAYMNFDQGAMWAKEAIAHLQFTAPVTLELVPKEPENTLTESVETEKLETA